MQALSETLGKAVPGAEVIDTAGDSPDAGHVPDDRSDDASRRASGEEPEHDPGRNPDDDPDSGPDSPGDGR